MAPHKVQNRQAAGRIFRRRVFYGIGAGLAAAMVAVSLMPPAGPASAQDAGQPGLAQPPGAPAQPAQPTTDPITNEQIELLKESGLIDKQSRLSEGLLLMERQLRQAELVGQLLAVLGPDAQIEVTPGEFKSFADTPAGLQQRLAYMQLQSQIKAASLEGREGDDNGMDQRTGTWVREIYGKSDDLVAVISSEGRSTVVAVGDTLEDGREVLSISPERIELQKLDGTFEVLRAP